MNKFVVTLSALRKARACGSGYNRVVRAIQGREFSAEDKQRGSYIHFSHRGPISIRFILDSNGFDDALWALRCIDNADKDIRLFAVWCARQVAHLMGDSRSTNALAVAERHAYGAATDDELCTAWDAANAAVWAAARDAAWDAARDAAWAAAWAAAGDAAWAAAAAAAAARDVSRDAAKAAQHKKLIEMLEAGAFQGDTKSLYGDKP